MSLRTKFFALTYDRQMAKTEKAGLRAFRERLLAAASGDVLEIGGGTGANLPYYGPAVGSLAITEPQPPMLRHLERNVRAHCSRQHGASQHGPDIRVLRAPAEDLPFDDHSFDVAVSTLVLCGVDDQPRALRELRRVLRPGGRLLFIEHVRSDDPGTARLQDRMNWLNRLVVCCDCSRPTLDSIRSARLHCGPGGAHGPAEGPALRPPRHLGHRHGSRGHATCTARRRPAHGCAAPCYAASRMSAGVHLGAAARLPGRRALAGHRGGACGAAEGPLVGPPRYRGPDQRSSACGYLRIMVTVAACSAWRA